MGSQVPRLDHELTVSPRIGATRVCHSARVNWYGDKGIGADYNATAQQL
jgi:hypothetical protein